MDIGGYHIATIGEINRSVQKLRWKTRHRRRIWHGLRESAEIPGSQAVTVGRSAEAGRVVQPENQILTLAGYCRVDQNEFLSAAKASADADRSSGLVVLPLITGEFASSGRCAGSDTGDAMTRLKLTCFRKR